MMRRTSYHLVEAHKLDKSILVCDEEGNATYVLDTSQLTRAGIQSGDLLQLSKAELNHLIEQEPLLGQRLVYSQSYVSSVINSLQQLTGNNSIKPIDIEAQGKYLYPRAPADILSIRGIAKALVIDHKTATRAINMLGDQLGETGIYRFGTHNIVGYSLEQQAWIAAQLEANGAFAEKAPEGYMSVGGIADELDVSHLAVTRAINMLGDQLGETGIYRFRQQKVTGYSLEQQAWIVAQLESNGLFTEKAPEDYLSLQGLADSLNVSDSIVAGVIEVLGDQLGETGIYKFGSNATVGYSTEQQAKIAAQLEANGAFAEKAPEGYLSIKGIAKAWNIDNTAVGRARKMIGDQLGAAESYKFGSNATVGYSLEQQAWIVAQLESNGLFTDKAPEDYLSLQGLANALGVSPGGVSIAIKMLGDQLGETGIYRFNQQNATGYSLEQQAWIAAQLEANGAFAEKAPEGYMSVGGIADSLGIGDSTVKRAIRMLGDELGKVEIRRFGSRSVTGYSQEQQAKIAAQLEANGHFTV
jgi:biotin operon repressor